MNNRVYVPVICQNGHKAVASFRLEGLDFIFEGVSKSYQCSCPKAKLNEGYKANGEPFIKNLYLIEQIENIIAEESHEQPYMAALIRIIRIINKGNPT